MLPGLAQLFDLVLPRRSLAQCAASADLVRYVYKSERMCRPCVCNHSRKPDRSDAFPERRSSTALNNTHSSPDTKKRPYSLSELWLRVQLKAERSEAKRAMDQARSCQ